MKIEKYNRGSYRFYNIHNKYDLPSVTTILGLLPKPKLIFWAVANTIKFLKAHGDLSKASTSLGYVFHKKLLDLVKLEEGYLYLHYSQDNDLVTPLILMKNIQTMK